MNDTTKTIPPKSAAEDIFEAVALNNEASVKHFVEVERVSLKSLNKEKQTAAHVAAQHNHVKLLKYLLKKDSSALNSTDHYGNNVLFWAIQKGSLETVEYLMDVYELKVNERNTLYMGNSAIHVAAEHGQLEILKYFLESKYGDVNVRNDLGESPIFSAADKTQFHIVKYLVEERKANVTMTDDSNSNVLYVCAKTGKLEVPKYLLDDRKVEFDINHRNEEGCTVTFTAAKFDNLDLVKYFVEEKHADVNIADENGRTPLHEVADTGHFDMVKYLVERGADFKVKDKASKKTALQMTTDDEIKKYLKKITSKRNPRSVFELLPRTSATPCLLRERENCLQIHESETFERIVFSRFEVWLAMASACVSFFTDSHHHKQSIDQSLMSPPEIILRRTDPRALEAAINFPDSWRS